MNVELFNPFINAVFNCMGTMVGIQPERQTPYKKDNPLTQGDITGIIGFAEKSVMGSVSLGFPAETILRIYNIILNEAESRLTREVQDLAGELTNIVAGGAKKVFAHRKITFKISIPTVVIGKNKTIHLQLITPVIAVPFLLDESPFTLEVAMKVERRHRTLLINGDTP